ncbi:MAG TPA: acyltransferase [Candidatus Sulfotelmatobacter sp.]|nr:acyltransferase [Candidatus Sulfotelmatobacter sp.]
MSFEIRSFRSHGTGEFRRDQFRSIGENVTLEPGVLVFHPENISLGSNVYIGHYTILKGYYRNQMTIGDNTWVGQGCFFHSAGGLVIGSRIGIGPGVRIITSYHEDAGIEVPILFSPIKEDRVVIEDDCDLGVGAIILPGVTIGRSCQIGAGAVVTENIPPGSVAAGVPARVVRKRTS